MGRRASGSVEWHPTGPDGAGHWDGRPLAQDGKSRLRLHFEDLTRHTPAGRAAAKAKSLLRAGQFSRGEIQPIARADQRETADQWFARYLERHGELGNLTKHLAGPWRVRISPVIGATPIARVSRDQIVRIRNGLTLATQGAEDMSPKRALNLWSDLIKAPLSRAFSDDDPKYGALRVAPSNLNPSLGLKPPVDKDTREAGATERQYLYPVEFSSLMACANIPVEWRRLYALASCTYLRPEELYGLGWADVRLDVREIHVRRSRDARTDEIKPPKTKAGKREVPIPESLLPLLIAMKKEGAPLVPAVARSRDVEKNTRMLRVHLKMAGVDRAELHEGSDATMAFDFRSLRTTGITWSAMAGVDSFVLALRAGHKSPSITWASYAKQGPDLMGRYGTPFPKLPADLISPRLQTLDFDVGPIPEGFPYVTKCEGGDLNPYVSLRQNLNLVRLPIPPPSRGRDLGGYTPQSRPSRTVGSEVLDARQHLGHKLVARPEEQRARCGSPPLEDIDERARAAGLHGIVRENDGVAPRVVSLGVVRRRRRLSARVACGGHQNGAEEGERQNATKDG